VITSPAFRPAVAAGLPAFTASTLAPAGELEPPSETPRYGYATALPAIRSPATVLTVSEGTAKPTPELSSLPSVAICTSTPTTSPLESINGPPELPWLIAASVWIASGIV
jgi:hypothetical protein